MNNPPTGLFEEEWKRALPSMAFNIVIVYETAQDEMQAKRFSDQVADEVANGWARLTSRLAAFVESLQEDAP